jgi:cell division protein FtsW
MQKLFVYIHSIFSRAKRGAQNVKEHKSIDRGFIVAIILLSCFGIVMVYNTSIPIALRSFSSPYVFLQDQVVWFLLGAVAFYIASRFDYHMWYALSVPLLFGTLLLLVAVFIPVIGMRLQGASRWINFGLFVVQPSEIAKLSVSIYLSAWFSSQERDRFKAFLLFMGMVLGLVILQPDMGTSIILLLLSLSSYVVSGAPIRQIVRIVPIVVALGLIVALIAPYRFNRLTSFFQQDKDPLGSSYQIRQALIALGSGGLTGVGLGKSRQKYEYLPEANTDAIFAVIAEEIGFLGSLIPLGLILFITLRGLKIARGAPDVFGKLLAVTITSWFGFQSVINIGAIVKLFPLTGVPLPLVSYGGSSTVVLLTALGILAGISRTCRYEK